MTNTDQPALTEAAAFKVSSLIKDEGNADLRLRVFVSGGGSSGIRYGFTFDENNQTGDTEIEQYGVKLLIDPTSYQYLIGAEIDYTEGVDGSQFVVRNSNDEPPPPVTSAIGYG